jgi:aquaporin Z
MKKYIVEFIGTFFLVLAIGCSVIGGAGAMAPLAIGAMLMVMIYAGGHISGAHYNPAVTLAVWMRGKCATSDVPMYMVSQFLGATLAAVITGMLVGASPNVPGALDVTKALLGEFLGTFALAYVVLNVATSRGTEGNSFYGLAIGFTVTSCAYALGALSGGAFNPAVALGVSIMGLSDWANIWIFVACFAGAAAAAFTFQAVNPHND